MGHCVTAVSRMGHQSAPLSNLPVTHTATSNGEGQALTAQPCEFEPLSKQQPSSQPLTANDSWLAVAENQAVGVDALKRLEADAASMVMTSTSATGSSSKHQHASGKQSSSVTEATPKLHHHHHHHHHYHHHHHTLSLACENQQLIKALEVISSSATSAAPTQPAAGSNAKEASSAVADLEAQLQRLLDEKTTKRGSILVSSTDNPVNVDATVAKQPSQPPTVVSQASTNVLQVTAASGDPAQKSLATSPTKQVLNFDSSLASSPTKAKSNSGTTSSRTSFSNSSPPKLARSNTNIDAIKLRSSIAGRLTGLVVSSSQQPETESSTSTNVLPPPKVPTPTLRVSLKENSSMSPISMRILIEKASKFLDVYFHSEKLLL